MSRIAGSKSGSLLVITLSLVAVLSVFAVAMARYLSLELRLTKYRLAREQAQALARSGVYLALQRLAEDAQEGAATYEAYDWLMDDWAVGSQVEVSQPPGATIELQVTDEERRLNLNTAPEPVLESALSAASASPSIAKAIVDYRDDPELGEDRPQWEPPYYAKNGWFLAPEELADLPEMDEKTYAALRATTSPYLASEKLNINTVTYDVLVALGFEPATAEAIRACRGDGKIFDGPVVDAETVEGKCPGVSLSSHEIGLLGQFGVVSQVFTVVSEGVMTTRPAMRVRIEAVVRRAGAGCEEGVPTPCVVAWRES
ncbi:MAG: type II secretion system protein GspK [Candidatus Omnitrophota bacterium]|nr:type II secretion system protein GspK [Candidatus Omnitrophota bacterium]